MAPFSILLPNHHDLGPSLLNLRSPASDRPTRTLPEALSNILKRQDTTTATTTVTAIAGDPNNNTTRGSTLDTGSIAGIIIGSIVGFLLLLWIIRSCANWSRPQEWGEPGNIATTRSHSPHHHPHHHHHHHHQRHGDNTYYSATPPPRHHRSHRRSSHSRRSPRPIIIEKTQSASPRQPVAVYTSRGRTKY
jgi:hypothetical protein